MKTPRQPFPPAKPTPQARRGAEEISGAGAFIRGFYLTANHDFPILSDDA